jgi:hypothetical protein
MKFALRRELVAAAAGLAIALTSVPTYAQDDLDALRQQLEAMKARLAAIEAAKAQRRINASTGEVRPRSWRSPGVYWGHHGCYVRFSPSWPSIRDARATQEFRYHVENSPYYRR